MEPRRGPGIRELDVALPPPGAIVNGPRRDSGMPALRGTRPLKRWRYLGAYGPELMICVGEAYVGPFPQRWWAVALPDGTLHERTTVSSGGLTVGPDSVTVRAPNTRIDLAFDPAAGPEPVESVNPSGARGYVWTRKQAGLRVKGTVELDGTRRSLDSFGAIDDTAGYHRRDTEWRWSAGVGTLTDGRPVGWNLVEGVNDDVEASERTVWVGAEPIEIAPVAFDQSLSGIWFASGESLDFQAWASREHSLNLMVARSRYRQPFGTFSGALPGGLDLAVGYGVMEWHDVRW